MRLRPNEDVVWTGDADEVRLYDAATGDFQTLNATAARIWQLIARGKPVPTVVADLVTDFAGDDLAGARVIEADVLEFVATLRAARLLVHTAMEDEPAIDEEGIGADVSPSC